MILLPILNKNNIQNSLFQFYFVVLVRHLWYTFYGENMRSIISRVLILIYLLIVITVSGYIFMYDSLGISSDKKYTIFASENLKSFKEGSLIIAKKNHHIKVNDSILFYNFYTNKNKILEGKVISYEKTNDDVITYELDNQRFVSSNYVLGNLDDANTIPLLGYVFKTLTSAWGYLLFALIPTMILFVYQLNNFIKTVKIGGASDDQKIKKK